MAHTPLLSRPPDAESLYRPGEHLSNCVISLYEQSPRIDPDKVPRLSIKTTGAALSFISNIPYWPISLKLGRILGPLSCAGNTVAFFVLEYWSAAGTADDLFGPKTREEIDLFQSEQREKKPCRLIMVISVSSLIALASQLPNSLAGMKYNKEQYKLVAGLVMLISGSLIPMRSLQLSIEQLRKSLQNSIEGDFAGIQAKMLSLIKTSQNLFVEGGYQKQLAWSRSCSQSRDERGSSEEESSRYILALLQNDEAPVKRSIIYIRSMCNYLGLVIGSVAAGVFEYALANYTYTVSREEIYDSTASASAFAFTAVCATGYLYGTSVVRTTQRIFNLLGNALTGKETRNLGWQFRPKMSFALTSIGLLTDLLALGASYIIWGDFYNRSEFEHQFFQKTIIASSFLLLFTATLDIIDEIVSLSIENGTEEEKEILKLYRDFQKLSEIMSKSSAREFIGYLTNLDAETRNILFERMLPSADQMALFATPESIN